MKRDYGTYRSHAMMTPHIEEVVIYNGKGALEVKPNRVKQSSAGTVS